MGRRLLVGSIFSLLLAALVAVAPVGVHAKVSFAMDSTQSQASYAVEESFFMGAVSRGTAVGVTHGVEGTISMDLADPGKTVEGLIEVDISQFTSDNERRDNRIRQEWLESAKYPVAQYVIGEVEGLDSNFVLGEEIPVRVHGDLTVREVTRPTTFEGFLVIHEDRIEGDLAAHVLMTDFGFDPPSIAGVLRAENEVELNFQFVALRGGE